MGLNIEEESRGEISILYLKGEIDSVTSHKFKDRIKLLIEQSGYKIIVDMEDVTYLVARHLEQLSPLLKP